MTDILSTSLIAALHVNLIEAGLSEDKGVRWVVVAKVILRVVHSSWFNSCTCPMARTDTARQKTAFIALNIGGVIYTIFIYTILTHSRRTVFLAVRAVLALNKRALVRLWLACSKNFVSQGAAIPSLFSSPFIIRPSYLLSSTLRQTLHRHLHRHRTRRVASYCTTAHCHLVSYANNLTKHVDILTASYSRLSLRPVLKVMNVCIV